jgi:broad specificity phosphatase PhoE
MNQQPGDAGTQRVPDRLWVMRHGQSAGNVARDAAEAAGLAVIDLADRDMDVPLSSLGEQQSQAIGEWFAGLPAEERPTDVLSSPYRRARQTAERVLEQMRRHGETPNLVVDERLREKEFGVLDRLTRQGIREKFADLDLQRAHVGKFYFRPPGGESWCDVILRLRSVQDTLARDYRGRRVLIVAHQVIVTCFRYLLEKLDEGRILAIDREGDVPNCGVTDYVYDSDAEPGLSLVLNVANFVAPLHARGAPVTRAPDVPVAPKP